MNWFNKFFGAAEAQTPAEDKPLREAAGSQSNEDDEGWTRLSGDYAGSRRDLTPMRQDRMQRIAEWLWQSNLLANRLVELPLAYLLAEGVTLQCTDEDNQKLLDGFWRDPINNFPLKLEARARDLALKGEQCYIAHVNTGNGVVRLGYLDAGNIAHVVMDPDNPEQPIGVVTKKDAKGKHHKYRVIVLGEDSDLFSDRTVKIRADTSRTASASCTRSTSWPPARADAATCWRRRTGWMPTTNSCSVSSTGPGTCAPLCGI